MRNYPTAIEMPSRKMRKALRKKIFAENLEAMKLAREARRLKRTGEKK